jgi:lipopolysaccharide transport protein LptA
VTTALSAAPAPNEEATITSDELQILNSGATTVFKGNVVLTQDVYVLKADRMTQSKATKIVEAHGRVHGTWLPESGEKVVATGRQARYTPSTKITELWGKAKLTRWETLKDTQPVVISAHKFTAYEADNVVYARDRVRITQGKTLWATSDEAKYDQTAETVELWGPSRVAIHWEDARGIADFESDRARVWVSERRGRLIDQVKGRVTFL